MRFCSIAPLAEMEKGVKKLETKLSKMETNLDVAAYLTPPGFILSKNCKLT